MEASCYHGGGESKAKQSKAKLYNVARQPQSTGLSAQLLGNHTEHSSGYTSRVSMPIRRQEDGDTASVGGSQLIDLVCSGRTDGRTDGAGRGNGRPITAGLPAHVCNFYSFILSRSHVITLDVTLRREEEDKYKRRSFGSRSVRSGKAAEKNASRLKPTEAVEWV
ncbi:hypothetical protein L249_7170 [Ophiocordyceps polyrhachis-furcata BCC 54312]|uniref:Uncharacterized protein n=1 Tax=Ophiocordyceps polyrhachis-furcata BCC 54312 TaxID=1330021 RepID=A0A367LB98_9HYPO|nr:hypothetical protein L249_7170 [Ophiocordyceps polyrhachis-furcata BCC 54312]